MKQRILATALKGLSALFSEVRAHPAHAISCQTQCALEYDQCLSTCHGNATCARLCGLGYEACLAQCPE
jgi:hypothetical protein